MNQFFIHIFISVIQIGYQASITVFFVIFARIFLNLIHIPKRYSYFLWLIPFIRLVSPIQPQSTFSLLPDSIIPASIGITIMDQPVLYIDSETIEQTLQQTSPTIISKPNHHSLYVWIFILAVIWIIGLIFLLAYSVYSFIRLKHKICINIQHTEHIYLVDNIPTAFVMGIFPARIYLPSDLSNDIVEYVICHEQQHIKRKDHIIKIILFLFTCFYWIHPLIWIAYILANKDIEFACDEAVIHLKPFFYRQKYAEALLTLSIYHKKFLTIPLSFSEGSPKERIKHIISYKKPMLLLMINGVIVMVLLSLGLLTNPIMKTPDKNQSNSAINQNSVISQTTISQPPDQQMIQESEQTTEQQEKLQTGQSIKQQEILQIEPSVEQQETPQTEKETSFELKTPEIDLAAITGADDPRLYYVDESIIIFGGYFGLFVYSKTEQTIIRGIDLEEIGCSATQGDRYCEIFVSSDGTTVYLHPIISLSDGITTRIHPVLSKQVFLYQISDHTLLIKENYQIDSNLLYKGVNQDGNQATYQINGEERICTLQHSGTIGSISWSEDSEIYHNFFSLKEN